jgi:hypothetical protein
MTSAMMMERSGMGMAGLGAPAAGALGTPAMTPGVTNMMMVPRCTMKMEKCTGGVKITCTCEDKVSAGMLQNLCTMMAGGMCSCYCILNGMVACCCNLMMGQCKCEPTENGVCLTCTSGDKDCCAMIQACCESCNALMKVGCTCCMMMNGMPVCCSC